MLKQALDQHPDFRRRFCSNALDSFGSAAITCPSSGNLTVYLRIDSNPHVMDKMWGRRIQRLVRERMEVEESLAVLSTLGGAYSSLGERDSRRAVVAGNIARLQLLLSSSRGDPNLVMRCCIYQVYSLCQRGLRRRAAFVLKTLVHPTLSQMMIKSVCDEAVKNMYRAAVHRIRYLSGFRKG